MKVMYMVTRWSYSYTPYESTYDSETIVELYSNLASATIMLNAIYKKEKDEGNHVSMDNDHYHSDYAAVISDGYDDLAEEAFTVWGIRKIIVQNTFKKEHLEKA